MPLRVCLKPDIFLSSSINKCCLLNIEKIFCIADVHMSGVGLPAVEHTRHLNVIISSDLSSSVHWYCRQGS